MMSTDMASCTDASSQQKKPRPRLKHLNKQICQQIEFYFSDANLMKDRYLKQLIDEDKHGYVLLDEFCKFNKVKALTLDTEVIKKALGKSKKLQVSSDGCKVKRNTPFRVQKDADERIIYVECLPREADHDWLRQIFAKYGKVLYTSIPRYKSTNDIKGFAFVEFDTVESAENACQCLGTEDKSVVGRFPKTHNKQMQELLRKQASGPGTEAPGGSEESLEDDSAKRAAKRRRKDTSESSSDEATMSKQSCLKGQTEESDVKNNDEKSIENRLSDKENSSTSTEQTDTAGAGKKRPADSEPEIKPVKRVRINEEVQVKIHPAEKRNRKRNRIKKSTTDPFDESGLKVLSKIEWLHLKREYLSEQKASMKKLKEALKSQTHCAQRSKSQTHVLNKSADTSSKAGSFEGGAKTVPPAKPILEFMSNVIVKVASATPSNRKHIKELCGLVSEVAYVDMLDGDTEAYVRCTEAESATRLLAAEHSGISYSLVEGDEEKQYWAKILTDRERKLNCKSRSKKKGSKKLLDKADKASLDAVQKKHVVFDD